MIRPAAVTATRIHAANPGPFTGEGNWTYVVPGTPPLLIDAGVGRPAHLDALAAVIPDGPLRVVITHAHPDHASGVPALAGRWPAATFHKVPWRERDCDAGVAWQPIEDGSRFHTDEGTIEVLHTPGHAPDHVALWHAASRTLFGGDLLQLGNTVAIPASSGGDLRAYLHSLRRVQALAPSRVLPAHGPVIDNPLGLIEHYLAHRHQREVQVIAALEAHIDHVEAIADRIYTGLTPQLGPLARESVLAHLVKLEHDGFARREGDRWALLT